VFGRELGFGGNVTRISVTGISYHPGGLFPSGEMSGSVLSDQLGGSWRSNLHAFEPLHADSPEDLRMGEPSGTAPLHFVPPSEETPDAIMDMMIDGPIGRPAGT